MPGRIWVVILTIFNTTLIIQPESFGQATDSLSLHQDSLNVYFEKIMLDGQVSYRNESTNEIISESEYKKMCDPAYDRYGINYDYWHCDRINPYKDIVLTSPFMIEFEQTTFSHPVDGDIVVTSRFGRRRGGAHRGLDIDLVTGDNVRAVLPGKVRFVGYSRGHGRTIVIRHANDVETVYAHLSAYEVKVNDEVSAGQIIGSGGNSGNSRGSHLHLEVRYKGVCIHPEYVFNFDGSRSIRASQLWISNAWKTPRFHSSYRKSDIQPLLTEEEAIIAQNQEPRYYKVQRGDTLSHIALKYNLGVKEICKLNRISKNSILRIGQIVQVR